MASLTVDKCEMVAMSAFESFQTVASKFSGSPPFDS